MHLRNGRLVRTDIWREGEYLDLWSVPHFLSGMAVALGLAILGLSVHVAVVVAFAMLVAWEFFEYFADIEEGRMNSMMDVVVGMFSFAPTFWWATGADFSMIVIAFVAVTGIDLVISSFGWVATRKAYVLERALLEEFREKRESIRGHRREMKERFESEKQRWRERRKQWKARKRTRLLARAAKLEADIS